MNNLKENILFTIAIIGLPILVNFIVETLSGIITMQMIMKVAYLILGALIIYFIKEGR